MLKGVGAFVGLAACLLAVGAMSFVADSPSESEELGFAAGDVETIEFDKAPGTCASFVPIFSSMST